MNDESEIKIVKYSELLPNSFTLKVDNDGKRKNYFLAALMNKQIHPAIKRIPPMGVIAPRIPRPVKQSK